MKSKRLERINAMKQMILQADAKETGLDKNKLVATAACTWGTSRRTALEYIDAIILTEYAYEEDGVLFLKK